MFFHERRKREEEDEGRGLEEIVGRRTKPIFGKQLNQKKEHYMSSATMSLKVYMRRCRKRNSFWKIRETRRQLLFLQNNGRPNSWTGKKNKPESKGGKTPISFHNQIVGG